ncbi:aryl hydrocarbon receptor 2 [Limanda limanda]|uniref:aryl hydrocarbon receptor 2 n=1 Tax=Limanda limanda TaxID=27771 RepID=UPI0029C8BBEC|nr:aryl hydrocarbon receptor 2 [Limanda limanda]
MLPSTALYAAKKRKKPVQKIPKPPPPDGIKSNPSKRHRDRLNGELDKLTSLLPFTEEVRARLDKLSVLRLSVGYLKVKSFFNATMKKSQGGSSWTSDGNLMFGGKVQNALTPASTTISSSSSSSTPYCSQMTSMDGVSFSEGDLLLQALSGFVLVATAEGYVFYMSPTIQDFLGFHQSDVVHQSVFELIHTDDRALFRRQLHFALKPNASQSDSGADSPSENSAEITTGVMTYDPQAIPPENSSFLERNFCCRFRCLLDNSSGFLALNFRGRLKFLHGQNRVSENGTLVPPQLALFAIATPLQPPSILEIRSKTLIFQSKHQLDFTPMGIDPRGKVVLGYSETELCTRGSGYHFIHAADMMYCADNHIKMIKTGESGFTVFRLLKKTGVWVWVQANARLVFKGAKPDFIIARQRALTNEEGEEQLRKRRLQLPFSFTTGEALLYDNTPTVDMPDMPDMRSTPKQRKMDEFSVSPNSMLGCILRQDQSVYCEHNSITMSSLNDAAFKDTHATVSVPGDIWPHASPKPAGNLVKSEAMVQDMMETLQQILGDGNVIGTLDVEPEEIKSWETMLLRMSSNTSEMSEDLNDILNNDILSYVEEQLQKEGGFKLPGQLDLPASLSALDHPIQNPSPAVEQNFGWPLEPQSQLISNGGPMMNGQTAPVLETMKLTHMDLPQLGSSALNGPTLQQIASQQMLPTAVGLGMVGAPVTFNPSLADSCVQTHNELRSFQVAAKENNLGAFRQTNQLHPNQVPNHVQMMMPGAPIGLQDQSGDGQLNPVFNFQGNRWNSSVQNSNQVNHFAQSYTQNISVEPGFPAGAPPSSCLQGHFALHTHSSENQRQSWQQLLEQQQLLSGGRQQMGAGLNHMSGLQRNPPQTTVNGRPVFRSPETPPVPFAVQQNLEPPPLAPSSSCMFGNAPVSVPVNGLPLGQVSACKQMNATGNNQILSHPACFYQGGGSVLGMPALPNPGEAPLSCQVPGSLDLNGLLVQQQQYLNFSEQTQINSRPVLGNKGFPFPSLPDDTLYYSENK